jgi:phosphoribosylanthranilate isomerase
MARVKVCGVTREADVRAVDSAGADAVGVVADVSVDTPRAVSLGRAADLFDAASPFLTTVLVTMPDSPERAVDVVAATGPDVVQLHADFDVDDLRAVRAGVDASVFAVVDADDPSRARDVAPAVDAVVVDSVSESGAGGTGRTHDWDATADVAASLGAPVVLAGGLTPENVASAVETVRPYAVDVASGVEATGGVKNHDAVERFVRNANAADGATGSDEEVVA